MSNLDDFLKDIYLEFVPISIKYNSKYGNIDDNIIEITYIFHNINGKRKTIYLYIYNINTNITTFSNEIDLSIFSIWWNPSVNNFLLLPSANVIFNKKEIIYKKQYYNGNKYYKDDEEEKLLESNGINIEYFKKSYDINYEDRIIKELILNLFIINFEIIIEEEYSEDITIFKDDIDSYISNRIMLQKSLFSNRDDSYINKFNTNDNYTSNYTNKYQISVILYFILQLYNSYSIFENKKQFASYVMTGKSSMYMYDLFKKTFKHLFIRDIAKKLKIYVDIVIREKILDNYEITIEIKEKKIKFLINEVLYKTELTKEEEIYIKNTLLFYYKNKIYKLKYKDKFLNLVLNKFKLPNITHNINTDTMEKNKSYFKKIIELFITNNVNNSENDKKLISSKIERYDKILNHDKDIDYFDLIFSDKIEDVKKFINEDNDNILLYDPNINTITCISKKDLDDIVSNYEDNWFYDCSQYSKNKYLNFPYIKVPTASFNYYIEYQYLYSLFKSSNRLFYINKTDVIIEKTATYKNTPIGQSKEILDYVGAYHCQEESQIKLSTISTINIETVVIPKINKPRKTNLSLNKSYSLSSSYIP